MSIVCKLAAPTARRPVDTPETQSRRRSVPLFLSILRRSFVQCSLLLHSARRSDPEICCSTVVLRRGRNGNTRRCRSTRFKANTDGKLGTSRESASMAASFHGHVHVGGTRMQPGRLIEYHFTAAGAGKPGSDGVHAGRPAEHVPAELEAHDLRWSMHGTDASRSAELQDVP